MLVSSNDAYSQNGIPYEDNDGEHPNQGRDNNGLPRTAQQGLPRPPFFWQKGDHLGEHTKANACGHGVRNTMLAERVEQAFI